MPGTKAGGLKAAVTNRALYGPEFYSEIGRKGGKNSHTGGFYANRELAKVAGRKGGLRSRRGEAGYHSSSTKLASLATQCSQRKYTSIRVKLDDGLIVTIATNEIRKLVKLAGGQTSFENAFKRLKVVQS